jgi:5-formaminoimidazole-4-carboxamide-1-(beta)-D-ribofuranosyl 5'-monophosphate synthetase
MITSAEIANILSSYHPSDLSIGTICSHSALQIFHGARQEGFKTVGICTKERQTLYESFPFARPDTFLIVNEFRDILKPDFQRTLKKLNTIIIPHGSFVEYVGPEHLEHSFAVPLFGNRKTLEWERDRQKQRQWLTQAGLQLPKEYPHPTDIDGPVFVKFAGAKGGRGFFTARSERELHHKLQEKVQKGLVDPADLQQIAIQEFLPGVRYYPHYFYSLLAKSQHKTISHVELLSMDKRIEPIDESYRGLPDIPEAFYDYTVTGNQPVVIRESLLPRILEMGINTVNASIALFPPGMIGAFCLETIYHPDRGFTVFEVSARIVAGTNLYPHGSAYSYYLFNEPMSTGRRIAREIKRAVDVHRLEELLS